MEDVAGEQLTNGNHKQLARPDHVDNTLSVLEDLYHHLLFILGGRSILRVGARVHDAVHVQVKIVKLLAVRVGPCGIDGDDGSVLHRDRLLLHDGRYDLGVFGGQPPEGSGDAHLSGVTADAISKMRPRCELRSLVYQAESRRQWLGCKCWGGQDASPGYMGVCRAFRTWNFGLGMNDGVAELLVDGSRKVHHEPRGGVRENVLPVVFLYPQFMISYQACGPAEFCSLFFQRK